MIISELSKASKLTFLSYANQVISMLLAFFEAKVLTMNLSITDYGAFNQILTSVSLVSIVLCLNLGHGFIRFASSYDSDKKKQTFHTVLATQTIIYTFALLLILPFSTKVSLFLTETEAYYPCVFIGFLAIIAGGISNIQNYLLVSGKDVMMIKQNLYRVIIDVLFVVIAVLLYPTILGALLGYLFGELFCFLLFSIINHIDYHGIKVHKEILVDLLRFSLPLIVGSVTYWVINSSNRYFINYYWGLDYVGQFAIANRLPMMIVTIFTLLSTVFLSNTSRLFDNGDLSRVSYWFTNMIKVFILFGVSGATLLIVANRSITLILSTQEYLFPQIALFYLLLCVSSVSYGLLQIVSRTYDLEKKVKRISLIWTIVLVINVLFNYILIPQYGLIGSAWASVITFVTGLVLVFVMRPKNIRFNLSWIKIGLFFILSLILAYLITIVLSGYNFNIWLELLIASTVFIFVLVLGLLIRIIRFSELKQLLYKN